MWWLGLTVFTSVLAAPIQEQTAFSCLSSNVIECYSYPKGCSPCKSVVKITGNVYDITTLPTAPEHDLAVLRITETNGARHVVVCSPQNGTANSYEDRKDLVADATNLVTYLDGKATATYISCKVELGLVFNGTGVFHVASGSTIDGDLVLSTGQRLEQQFNEVHGASKIAGDLKAKDNATETDPEPTTVAAPSSKKTASKTTDAVTAESSSSASPETLSTSSVNSSDIESSEQNTTLSETTEAVADEKFTAENATSEADESSVVADDGKLSEAEIQKKQFEEAQTRTLGDDQNDEKVTSANTTVEEPAKGKKTATSKAVDNKKKPSETTTAATTTKSQPTDKLPAEAKPRSMDDDDDEDEEESTTTTTKKPVGGKKKAGSTTTTTKAPDSEEKADRMLEDDPDRSSTLFPFVSITFALFFTLFF